MPSTDYIRHAARLSRKIFLDCGPGGQPAPDAEFFKTLGKALDDIANELEAAAKRRD
jgi:hypothetical protein